MPANRRTALALFSGGLDSILAVRVLQEQGVGVRILAFYTVFHERDRSRAAFEARMRAAAAALGVEADIADHTEAMLALLHGPAHGFGKNLNPCIDCRIAMLRAAAARMQEAGASFLVTGEVLGQRPMSQRRHAMDLVERRAGVGGLLLRPLSARLLPETIPEREGWVSRQELPSIRGRSRKPQLALAERLGVADPPGSGGGCLLTHPEYARKVADALAHGDLSERHARILRLGRHFRLPSGAKAVVGRNERENARLEGEAAPGDALLVPLEVPGPAVLLPGGGAPGDLALAGGLAGRYMRVPAGARVRFGLVRPGGEGEELESPALSPDGAAALLSGRPGGREEKSPPSASI